MMLMLGIAPILAGIAFSAFVLAAVAAASVKARQASGIDWDPVWLGGEGHWGIKIYKASKIMDFVSVGDFRLEILFDGEFCEDWTFPASQGFNFVRAFAIKWTEQHPEGCPQ